MDIPFIWTEIFNCGPLGKSAVQSFLAHHQRMSVHVFGFEDDLTDLVSSDKVILHKFSRNDLPNSDKNRLSRRVTGNYLLEGYADGHLGTARLWAYLIKTRKENVLAHFDADIIFLNDALNDVLQPFSDQKIRASGPRRMYRYNLNGNDSVRNQEDCVDTYCFAFRPTLLKYLPYSILVKVIRGRSWINRLVRKDPLDFFDTFTYMLTRLGSIFYVDSPELGSFAFRNTNSQFHTKFIEVRSAVGSGCAFSKGYGKEVQESYRNYALESYSIYAFYILNVETGIPRPEPGELENQLMSLDKEKWCLKK